MKRILFASSEAVPFIKTGGLADVVGALPKYFDKERYDVRIIIPKYACIDEQFKKNLKYLTHFYVNLGWRSQYAGIFQTTYDHITYYLVDSEYYFSGDRPYHYLHEDLEKFAFFDKAVLQAIKKLDLKTDLIHCNDWQTALIPAYLEAEFRKDPYYTSMKTIFTIHNIRYQGRWKIDAIQDITGLPDRFFTAAGLETYGEADYLKGGIVYADKITTVSENYAREICTPEGGEGLDGVLRQRQRNLCGIINGIDDDVFDPKTDSYLERRYDTSDYLAGKRANKAALQEKLGLHKSDKVFLIGMVSRMTDQKGFDLLGPILDELLKDTMIQFVILGSGEEKYANYCRNLEWRHGQQVSVTLNYTEELAHRIYAGCDAFLMPSMFEPCGLSQMISMRYGTIPMVRETGGLIDTVEPFNEYARTETGFSFHNFDAFELLKMLQYAKSIYQKKRMDWDDMAKRCMEQDLSWERSAAKYENLYECLW